MSKTESLYYYNQEIRRIYDEETETWYFSVIDIIRILTNQKTHLCARNYWNLLKKRLVREGNQTITKCNRLKMIAADGKNRFTTVASLTIILRLIQSIPSPKDEPIKNWLTQLGSERVEEMQDPGKTVNRAIQMWKQKGASPEWIHQRLLGLETRNKLTDYWKKNGITHTIQYAILTNYLHKQWSGLTIQEHKQRKGISIKKQANLRNHMTEGELIFTTLAEYSTREIAKQTTLTK